MIEELETLCEVQQLDTKIIENERKRAIGPKKIEDMEREVRETKERLAKQKEVIEELEKERRSKEQELEGEKAQVKKVETKLAEVKTNKEYQAMLKEIEAARAGNDKTEEEVLVLLERVEELKKDYQTALKESAKREKEVAESVKELEKEIKTVDGIVSGLRKERERLLGRRQPGPEGEVQHPHREKGRPCGREREKRHVPRVLHEHPPSAFHRGNEEQQAHHVSELQQDLLLQRRRMKEYHIYIDGASLGNPGRSGAGMVAFDEEGNEVWREGVIWER